MKMYDYLYKGAVEKAFGIYTGSETLTKSPITILPSEAFFLCLHRAEIF